MSQLDLDELFRDCYFGDFPVPISSNEEVPLVPPPVVSLSPPPPAATIALKRKMEAALESSMSIKKPTTSASVAAAPTVTLSTATNVTQESSGYIAGTTSLPVIDVSGASTNSFLNSDIAAAAVSNKQLTAAQKVERRERNREHAKRSRLRKKFLLESLQGQIHGLQAEIEALTNIIKNELPDKAEELLSKVNERPNVAGADRFTPLPMPSGFGPVKTLMEPDFRLMSALSSSQQNFAISDPSLPDNPIVYVSQGFLDLTGYTLDQVLGRNCRFLQGPGTDQSAVDTIRKGVREGVDTSVCLLNYKADGTPFWNQFFVAALRDAENNVVNFVGVQCEVSKATVEKQMGKT